MPLSEDLQNGKVGRVPVWVMGVIIAGAIIVFVVVRKRMSKSKVTGDAASTGLDSVEGIPATSFADQISGGFPSNIPQAPEPEHPQTNAQWLLKAFDFLAGMGKDPGSAQRALQNYLAGVALTPGEQQLINLVLANPALSLPPEGVVLAPGTPAVPTPGPPGTPTPTAVPERVSVPLNKNLYDWVSELNAGYGLNLTFTQMFGRFVGDMTALNPGARGYMSWDNSNPKQPMFQRATPPMKIR